MSKKNFKQGLSSLLPDPQEPTAPPQAETSTKRAQDKKQSQETRATFILDIETLEKIKALAYWERKQIKTTIAEALETYLEAYEAKHGKIKPQPKK